jgi:peptide/nickel transport system substrate-binding protein
MTPPSRGGRLRFFLQLGLCVVFVVALIAAGPSPLRAQSGKPGPDEMRWALHVTLVSRWLDPAETEAFSTPFMVMYAIHDAMVRPMPAGLNTPSLAESWTEAKDHLSYTFTLRKGIRFHNGEPVTAEDVKFSWDRYKGASAKLLKDKMKDVQILSPGQVRFVLREPWPDFITFYGTTASGAGWIVPKKYVEKVGDDGFKAAPIGAGPYKVVSYKPGLELVLEAFDGYWRKPPAVKRLVMRSMPEETTRAAALKAGEVDIAYLLTGPTADEVRKTPGFRLAAPLVSGAFWIEMPEQWDPKSPWADPRVRLAASHAIDRAAINQSEMLGFGRLTGNYVPRIFQFALPMEPHAYDPAKAKKLLAEAGYPNGFDAGDLYPFPPYNSMGESILGYLQAVGIKSRMRTMERAAYFTAWREKKLHGLIVVITAAFGNAATRLEPYATKNGVYAYGSLPEIDDLSARQARELDVKKREAMVHDMQKAIREKVTAIPLFEQAFIWGVGPRVEDAGDGRIPGFSYSAPFEDLRLKK